MKILVTGVAGFIGSHLAERLVARGDQVVGLDNFDPYYDEAIKQMNLEGVRGKVEVVRGDILDAAGLDRLFTAHRFDRVVHLAALAGVRPSLQTPWRYQRVNVEGTSVLAEAILRHQKGTPLVFASSSSVYGDNTQVPYRETDRVDQPASPYAASKRAGELLLRSLHRSAGLSSCSLRFFTVYGPRQRPDMAIHKFTKAVLAGKPITMFGDGTTSRDYTYVDDVIQGVVGAIDRAPKGLSIYNLGNNRPVTLKGLIEAIGVATGKTPKVEPAGMQPGDVDHTLASIDAAGKDLGYAPKVPIEEGLRRFVEWLQR